MCVRHLVKFIETHTHTHPRERRAGGNFVTKSFPALRATRRYCYGFLTGNAVEFYDGDVATGRSRRLEVSNVLHPPSLLRATLQPGP